MDTMNIEMFDTATTKWQSEAYMAVLEEDEDGVVATIPTLRGCISQGDAKEDALNNLADALSGWLEVAEKRGFDIPSPP